MPPSQSSFRTGNSCKNQFLSINYDISHSFDKGMDTRAIPLDISKTFYRV